LLLLDGSVFADWEPSKRIEQATNVSVVKRQSDVATHRRRNHSSSPAVPKKNKAIGQRSNASISDSQLFD
jgi:hypothetical protein